MAEGIAAALAFMGLEVLVGTVATPVIAIANRLAPDRPYVPAPHAFGCHGIARRPGRPQSGA